MIKVAVEIRLKQRKLNRNRGFNFSWFWSLVTKTIKQYRHNNPSKLTTQPTSPLLAHAVSIIELQIGIEVEWFGSNATLDQDDGNRDGP
jgi:hypothetical protein